VDFSLRLVLKTVSCIRPLDFVLARSWSYDQGCSLGLDVSVSRRSRDVVSKRLGLVSVSRKRGKVSVSISSRIDHQMSRSRLGLVP